MDKHLSMLISWSNPNMPNARLCSTKESTSEINWNSLLRLAEKNKVTFFLCRNLIRVRSYQPHVINAFKKEKEHRARLFHTLETVIDFLRKEHAKFLVIKTLKPHDQVGGDVDILIIKGKSEIRRLTRKLMALKYKVKLRDSTKYTCRRNGKEVDVDFYPKIAWWGITFLDNLVVWKRKRRRKINNSLIYVPSPEDVLLIACSQALKEGIRLGDLYLASALVEESTDFDYMLREASIHGWSLTLLSVLYAMSFFYKRFFKESPIPERIFKSSHFTEWFFRMLLGSLAKNKTDFPYSFPPLPLLCMLSHKIWSRFLNQDIKGAINDLNKLATQVFLYFQRLVLKLLGVSYRVGPLD